MSRNYSHARRPADAGPVEEAPAPRQDFAAPTPQAVPVAGVARVPEQPIARKPGSATDPLGGTEAGADVVDALKRRRGSGKPLPAHVAQNFGAQLGTDLSSVRVHTDGEADQISRSVAAKAFTHGSDIYFTSGTYDPSGGSGQHLLAHELTHVAQAATGQFRGTGGGTQIGRADDPAEQHADRTADQVVSALRRSPAAPQDGAATAVTGDSDADGGEIRRASVAELTKLYEANIAAQKEQKAGSRRPHFASSGPEANEEKAGGYNMFAAAPIEGGAVAYSTPALNEEEAEAPGPSEVKEGAARPAYSYGSPANAVSGAAYTEVKLTEPAAAPAEEAKAGGVLPSNYEAVEVTEPAAGEAKAAGEAEPVAAAVVAEEAKDGLGRRRGRRGGGPTKVESVLPDNYAAVEVTETPAGEAKAEGGEAKAEGGEAKAEAGAAKVDVKGSDEPHQEDVKLAEQLNEADKEDEQEAKAGGEAGPDAAAAEHKPGDSRKHRAWLLSELDEGYKNEKGKTKQEMASIIQLHLDRIAGYWKSLRDIEDLGPADSADFAANAGSKGLKIKKRIEEVNKPLGAGALKFYDEVKDLMVAPLAMKLANEHARCVEWLKRQDLPVHNNGTMDLPKVAGGSGDYDLSSRVVKYLEEDERKAAQVTFSGGILKRDGNWKPSTKAGGNEGEGGGAVPVDTDKSVTHFTGPGWEIFVASPEGEVYMTSHKIGMMHHSSLLAGANVLVAGEIKADHGRIVEMTNKSGHYVPSPEQLAQFLHFLDKDGISVDFKVGGFGVRPGTIGADLIAGRDATGAVNPKATYDAMKFKIVRESLGKQYGEAKILEIIAAQGWHMAADGQDVLDGENKPVDFKVVRQTLKEKLGSVKAKQTVQQRTVTKTGIELRNKQWIG